MKELKGDMNAGSLRLGIVVSRFNSVITEKLLDGAVDMIKRCGGKGENITILKVPGSFEIPIAALTLAKSGDYDALICLGCLIRGETPHFDFLAAETTRGMRFRPGSTSAEFNPMLSHPFINSCCFDR